MRATSARQASNTHTPNRKRIMEVRVTTYDRRSGAGELMLTASQSLYEDPIAQAVFGAKNYHRAVGRRLTPLGTAAVNHLCRGLDGVRICLQSDGNRIMLRPEGPSAATLYQRLCTRLSSSQSGELPLHAALQRDMGVPVDVVLAGSATPRAVPRS